MCTLLLKYVVQHRGVRSRFRVSIEIDDIVEIAGPATVAEGADLLGERFLIGVAEDRDPLRRRVAVVVEYGTPRRPQDEKLVRRQIELDARETTPPRRDRPPVAELALAGHRAARVLEDVELLELARNLDPGSLVDPHSDFAEDLGKEFAIDACEGSVSVKSRSSEKR